MFPIPLFLTLTIPTNPPSLNPILTPAKMSSQTEGKSPICACNLIPFLQLRMCATHLCDKALLSLFADS